MPLRTLNSRQLGLLSASLVVLVTFFIWSGLGTGPQSSVGQTPSGAPRERTQSNLLAQATAQPKATGAAAAAGTDRNAQLKADIEAAAVQLEAGKLAEFIDDYFPVDVLREIRRNTTVRQAARDPRLTSELLKKDVLKRMVSALRLCAKATPVLSQDNGVAVFRVTIVPEKSAAPAEAPPKVVAKPAAPALAGFGKDLPKALAAAAQAASKKKWEEFVLAFYPLQEAQHLKSSGQLADLMYVIQQNPDMEVLMQQDLARLQNLKPKMTDNNTVAEFRILTGASANGPTPPPNVPLAPPAISGSPSATPPPLQPADPERIIRLQLTDGNWRLFDSVSSVRKQIDELSNKTAEDSPETVTVGWERFGNRWRLLTLDFNAE